jgi:uncharacterized protein
MDPTRSNKPLLVFFVLSISLILLIALPGILANYGFMELNFPVLPLMVIGSWTPNIAAFVVIAFILKRKGGIRALIRRWTMWKVSPWWYLAALSPILAGILGAFLFQMFDSRATLPSETPNAGFLLAFLIISLITGAMGEELGWRGFALPWLQTRFNALWSSIILGIVWGLWHLPLWFTGMGWEEISFWLFAWVGIAMTIIITWICNSTRGNMVLVTLFHMSFNYGMGLMGEIWKMDMSQITLWMAIVLTAYMFVVLLLNGRSTLSMHKAVPVDHETKTWLDH